MFITTMVMALLAAVIYFVWRYGRGFGIIEALFARSTATPPSPPTSAGGCACRTRRSSREAGGTDEGLPVLRRGGAALHSPGEGASDGDLHRHDPLREPALRRGDAHAVSSAAVDEGPRAAGKAGDRETVEQKVWEWMNT